MNEEKVKIDITKKLTKLELKINECLCEFYKLMNMKADEIGLKKTNFAVAHGMHNENNYSTALDIGKLSCVMMKDERFQEIVKTKSYEVVSILPATADPKYEANQEETKENNTKKAERSAFNHKYKWDNTNFLLKEPGFTGLKTGITWSAGPCLAATCRREDYHVLVIVLSCCSMDSRWYEVPKLVAWGIKKV